MKEVETREAALERLLRVALDVIGEAVDKEPDLTPGFGQQPVESEEESNDICEEDDVETVLERLCDESGFWLDLVPLGSLPEATTADKRLGAQLLSDARKNHQTFKEKTTHG